jgi:hypothetical protein
MYEAAEELALVLIVGEFRYVTEDPDSDSAYDRFASSSSSSDSGMGSGTS